MIASARFEQNEAYFRELYGEWLRHGSRVRRWQPWIGIAFLGIGVALPFCIAGLRSVSVSLVIFGLFQIFENYLYQRNYLKSRLEARRKNEKHEIFMEFDAEGIFQTGPTASGKMKWAGIVGVKETPKGINLAIGDGLSIYIPKSAIEPLDAIPEIVSLARRGA